MAPKRSDRSADGVVTDVGAGLRVVRTLSTSNRHMLDQCPMFRMYCLSVAGELGIPAAVLEFDRGHNRQYVFPRRRGVRDANKLCDEGRRGWVAAGFRHRSPCMLCPLLKAGKRSLADF